ncbi:uncharacterized protein FOMMEDRAFT_169204 [Fomitiporia mediterranea MF3/22]|uniref:uncharacterized protein n=1 Tax=Fomitiporia mediterranea (strain MF3/22) TaxID=694068 RepID=UPI0004407B4A|nr:uncharacterized protein FOMMEDRAFT_169204 [Fomitiporia mediterranea MF3/22]EJD00998.1 hypothetical protein FOMMEDRAFT_169204 [Fomitiporia mediterranea MF3/22]
MRSRPLVILFSCLGASCRCLAAPIGLTQTQNPIVCGVVFTDCSVDASAATSSSVKHEPTSSSKIAGAGACWIPGGCSQPSVIFFTPAIIPSPATASLSPYNTAEPTHPMILLDPSSRPSHGQVVSVFKNQQRHRHRGRWRVVRQNPVVILFEVLGGLVGMGILTLCGRTVQSYYRTPRRDLVRDHMDRYNLERELAEIEVARMRSSSLPQDSSSDEPPPAYQEPPEYGEHPKLVPSTPRCCQDSR